jgi:hypothetical protein
MVSFCCAAIVSDSKQIRKKNNNFLMRFGLRNGNY